MDLNELLKILEYVKKNYKEDKLSVVVTGGWEWTIYYGKEVLYTWDKDYIKTFEDFKLYCFSAYYEDYDE